MDSYIIIAIMLAAGGGFLFYLFRTHQFKWLFRILRNAVMGVAGLLAGNWLLASFGLAVGVNLLTVFIVGVLGLPGLVLLYVTQWMV